MVRHRKGSKKRRLEDYTIRELKIKCKGKKQYKGFSRYNTKAELIRFMRENGRRKGKPIISESANMVVIQNPKDVTYNEYYFGDFDNDGLLNIDDQRPFKKSKKGIEETKLSDALKNLNTIHTTAKQRIENIIKIIRSLVSESIGVNRMAAIKLITPYRVKQPISTINKLVNKRLDTIRDFIAVSYLGRNYKELLKVEGKIVRKFSVIKRDDFYTSTYNPTGYKAIHLDLQDPETGAIFEMQLKTKRIKRVSELNHTLYKKGIKNWSRLKKLIDLAERADNGEEIPVQLFNSLSDKIILGYLQKKVNIFA